MEGMPRLQPLDYAELISNGDPQRNLMHTLEGLASWLKVVDDGFKSILDQSSFEDIQEEADQHLDADESDYMEF
jgi:hypothetical protein